MVNTLITFALASITKLGSGFISGLRARVADEVKDLDGATVTSLAWDEQDSRCQATVDYPDHETVTVVLDKSALAGAAKAELVIARLRPLIPATVQPVATQLIRLCVEAALLWQRMGEIISWKGKK